MASKVAIEKLINQYISGNVATIFSKSYCPYCNEVKALFQKLNIKYFAVELDQVDDGAEIQDALETQTGQRTVPNVFINGTHLGGCDKTKQAYQNGSLQQLLV